MDKKQINNLRLIDIPTQSEIDRRKLIHRLIKMTLLFFFGLILILSIGITYSASIISREMPNVSLLAYSKDQTTLIYDINDKLIANIHGDEDRVVVPLDKISPWLQRAVISIEDSRFFDHKGIDLMGTVRAAIINSSGGGEKIQGGSTLTQQLVKNSFLSPEKSIKRKLIEAILAVQVEKKFNKKQILEMYLNQIYWGNRCFGAEKAARRYFKKPAYKLDIAESAMLAGLLKAPEGYSPYTNFKGAKYRQKSVLERMHYYGFITENQKIKAENEPLKFATNKQTYSKYPYFVEYVIYLLRKTYGDDITRRGGLRVYTTLDPNVQDIAEKTIKDGIKNLPKGSGADQGALVSINVDNGYIQALVGGIDFKKSNYNRATQAKRAAGSSFKPVVYLTGFRMGIITPNTPILDSPICFDTGWNIWCPHNWDGKYMGRLNVRKALTFSRNTPTVRIALKVGVNRIIETARLVGIKSHINHDYSIALGSLGISPMEMATVFSTYAREGVYIEPIAIRKVEDSQHNILEINNPNPIRVISPNFVRELDSILVDVVEKGTGRNAKLDDRIVAGKTGTTDDIKDIWFTGFTPDTVTTIWIGNDKNTKLKGLFSSNCAQLWQKFSTEYYKIKNISPRYFNQPVETELANNKKKDAKDLFNKGKVRAKLVKEKEHVEIPIPQRWKDRDFEFTEKEYPQQELTYSQRIESKKKKVNKAQKSTSTPQERSVPPESIQPEQATDSMPEIQSDTQPRYAPPVPELKPKREVQQQE